MVWIVEWTHPAENEVSVSVYASENDALQSACADILQFITDIFDMSDTESLKVAKEINALVKLSSYQEAINHLHDYINSNWEYDDYQYWYVYEKDIHTYPQIPVFLTFNEEEMKEDSKTTYNAVQEGATCRGPCGQHYEYAIADKCDGTFVCRSCKLMSSFFGSEIA